MPEPNEMLEIAPGKVAHVIVRSRGPANSDALNEDGDPSSPGAEAGGELAPEVLAPLTARPELAVFLEALSEDEQASLVALMWIGRGTYAAGEIGEAIAAARAEHGTNAPAYLLSLPLLPEYLEDGLEQLGVSPAGGWAEALQTEGYVAGA
jgi:Protein of unknown function (DUF3775)